MISSSLYNPQKYGVFSGLAQDRVEASALRYHAPSFNSRARRLHNPIQPLWVGFGRSAMVKPALIFSTTLLRTPHLYGRGLPNRT